MRPKISGEVCMSIVRNLCLSLLIITGICISPCFADEAAIKKEMVDAVNYAADLVTKKGEASFDELKAFRFGHGGYVYIGEINGIIRMHPVAPELVNKNCTTIKDAEGKYFGAEMLAKATKFGTGWTSYMWPNPAKNKQPELKCSFYKVATTKEGKKYIVYAGSFGISGQGCQ
jgi:hypothetical protein